MALWLMETNLPGLLAHALPDRLVVFPTSKGFTLRQGPLPLKINIQITSEIRIFFTFVPGRETSAQVGTLQQDRATRDFGAELFSSR